MISDNPFDLELFFNLSHDLICIAGFNGYFKKVNQAVINTLGYSQDELFSRPINSFVYPEDLERTIASRESIKQGKPLLNFENRYVTKSGEIVWLLWTSVPVENQKAVFAIAKNITYRKKIEEYKRISNLLESKAKPVQPHLDNILSHSTPDDNVITISPADTAWLGRVEDYIKQHLGKVDLNLSLLSHELSMSERQFFRRLKQITGISPNKYIRTIKMQLAKEAIESGKYRTVAEVSYVAGFDTPAYFNKLFKEVYGVDAVELLKSKK